MTDRELMRQALDALDAYSWEQVQVAANALRDRLAQPEVALQYPPDAVEWQKQQQVRAQQVNAQSSGYAHNRQYVGLTDEEIKECFTITPDLFLPWHIYARIEAKLKEKNT
jgi:hypothetical protein